MKSEKPNMEDFLKDKLNRLETHYQDDWSVMEQKLERAIYMKQMRRAMLVGAVSILFLGFFIGVNSNYFYNGHIPQEQFGPNIPVEINEKPAVDPASSQNNSTLSPEKNFLDILPLSDINTANVQQNNSSFTHQNNKAVMPTSMNDEGKSYANQRLTSNNSTISFVSNNGEAGIEENFMVQSLVDLPFASSDFYTSRYNSGNRNIVGEDHETQVAITGFGSLADYGRKLDLRSPAVIGKSFLNRNTPYVSPLQEDNPWGYSINFYPNFTFRKFKVDRDKQDFVHNDFVDATQASEDGGFSLNIGFEVSRRIGAITFLNGGVEYISDKTEVAYDFLNFRNANMTEDGRIKSYSYKDEAERISFTDKNVYHYLNFPLSISYQPWASDHVRLNIEAGASYLLFLGANGQTLNYKTLEIIDLSERTFRNSMASVSIKLGANYYVNQRLNIGFEPTLRYFSNTIYTEEYPFYVIPYSVGMNFNIQIKLN